MTTYMTVTNDITLPYHVIIAFVSDETTVSATTSYHLFEGKILFSPSCYFFSFTLYPAHSRVDLDRLET